MECTLSERLSAAPIKIGILTFLTIIVAILTYICLTQNVQVIFTHFYYVPIILAGCWYRRRGVLYAVFLAAFYFTAVMTLTLPDTHTLLAAIGRALFFIGVSIVIALLSGIIHKQAERINQSEIRFRGIWEHIQAGIILVDGKTHTIIAANPEAQKLTGFTEEEMIGHMCHRFICPAEEGKCPIGDLNQKIDRTVRTLLTKDGREVAVLKTVTEVTIAGNPCYIETFIEIAPTSVAAATADKALS